MDDQNMISRVIGSLAVYVDARQWDGLLRIFSEEILVDYTSLFGGEAQATTREELIGGWKQLLPGFTGTTHIIGTPYVTVEGDTAKSLSTVVAWHFIRQAGLEGNDIWFVGGCYEMSFEKVDGTWRIVALTLARAWQKGNLDLPRIAADRVVGKVAN